LKRPTNKTPADVMKKIRNPKKRKDQENLSALKFAIANSQNAHQFATAMVGMLCGNDDDGYRFALGDNLGHPSNASKLDISDDGSECKFCGDVHDLENEDKNCLCVNCGITVYVGQHFPGYCQIPHENSTKRIPEQGNHTGRVSAVKIDYLRFSRNYPQKFRIF
jgi:hypothetical protein